MKQHGPIVFARRVWSWVLCLVLTLSLAPAAAAQNDGFVYQPNPEFGTYLGTREDGAFLFEITIPDDMSVQPYPLILDHFYAYAKITSDNKAAGFQGNYLRGIVPGKSTAEYEVWRENEAPHVQAVIDITVVPAREFDPTVNKGFALVQPAAGESASNPSSPPAAPAQPSTPAAVQETGSLPAGIGSNGAAQSDRGRTFSRRSDGNYDMVWVQGYKITNQDGSTTDERRLKVTTYSPDFREVSSRELPIELTSIGGVYFGASYNFLVFAQDNWEEDDSREVLRIVKYSKDWQRLGAASLKNAFTTGTTSQHGNFSYAEAGDMLYIHLGRSTYTCDDGQQHQTNMTFCIRQSDMVITDGRYGISDNDTGYVSHSMHQDIIVDQEGRIVTLDNGDSYPRGAQLFRYSTPAGGNRFTGTGTGATIRTWPGELGNVSTGAVTCALVETSQGYLSAIVDSGKGENYSFTSDSCTAYLLFTPKDNFSAGSTQTRTIAAGTASVKPTFIYLVPTSPEGGYVLWYTTDVSKTGNDRYTLYYTTYTADGTTGTSQKLEDVPMPYQGPIYTEGKLVWAGNATDPEGLKFCVLDASGTQKVYSPTEEPEEAATPSSGTSSEQPVPSSGTEAASPFQDIPTTHWAYSSILQAYQDGVMNGTGVAASGEAVFSPSDRVTMAQFMAILTRAFYSRDLEDSTASGVWYAKNYDVATRRHLFDGTASSQGNYELTREDMAQIMINVITGKGGSLPDAQAIQAAKSGIPDFASVSAGNGDAVAACYHLNLLTGIDSQGRFAPKECMNRAQTAAIYVRLRDALGGTAALNAPLTPAARPQSDFSDSYRSSQYYRNLLQVPLTGDYRQDILAIAASQIGYCESNSADQLDGSQRGSGDYSEYGRFLGSNGSAWCSEFASWCARMADVPSSILHSSGGASVEVFGAPYYSWGQTVYAGGSYTPRPGDLALFAWSGKSITDKYLSHTAIVHSVERSGNTVTITVIDGNSNNSVRMHNYTADASSGKVSKGQLVYFVAPDYEK